MSPKPFTENSQREYSTDHDTEAREVTPRYHRPSANTIICTLVIIASILAAAWIWTDAANARTGQTQPQPIAAPKALVKARAACQRTPAAESCLRGKLRLAYQGLAWARKERTHRWSPTVELAIQLACTSQPTMDCNWFRRMIGCESGRDPFSKNWHSTAAGLAQFLSGTWSGNRYHRFSVYNPLANALGAAWLAARNGHGPWYASRGCWS